MGQWLECTGCDARLSFPADIVHVYARGEVSLPLCDVRELGQWIPVPVRPGWCRRCNGPCYIERVPTAPELTGAAMVLRNPDRHAYIDDELLHLRLEDITFLFEGLAHRTTPPRCLMCGSSSDWIRLELKALGTTAPELRHSECGSPLRYHLQVGGRVGTAPLRVYSFSGTLIAEGITR